MEKKVNLQEQNLLINFVKELKIEDIEIKKTENKIQGLINDLCHYFKNTDTTKSIMLEKILELEEEINKNRVLLEKNYFYFGGIAQSIKENCYLDK